jgi:predicted peroxiredoxin
LHLPLALDDLALSLSYLGLFLDLPSARSPCLPAASREHPRDHVKAYRGDHGEYADQDGRAQHAVHSPPVYDRAARPASRRAGAGSACSRSGPAARVSAMPERSLVIKVTAGKDDPERCNQAFTVAAAAVASGIQVSLWLTGESAWFGLPGRAEDFSLPHAAPLADLLAGILAAGTVTVCTQCAARRGIEADDLIKGIRIAGAATFVAEIMTEGTQALVYLARV